MMNDQLKLREITSKIVDARRPFWSLGAETVVLHDLLQERAAFRLDSHRDIAEGETLTSNGLAVSPTQAAMCAREVARTAAFIRKIEQAIRDTFLVEKGRPIRVLYAGCGPYALLAIPQMSLFSSEQIQFVLLDIHEAALASARTVVESLGFTHHVIRYVESDACRYQIPAEEQPDIIISETMNVGLAEEPLVAIACHLLKQSSAAILIPSLVRVDAYLIDDGKEFRFVEASEKDDDVVPRRDRAMLGKIFELNAENARRWESLPGNRLPASRITIPSTLEKRYRPKLLTTVIVYGATILKDYDCSLTIPTPIRARRPINGGEVLEFEYRLGETPGLVCEVAP